MRLLSRIQCSDCLVVAAFVFFGIAGAIPGIAPNQANEMTGASASTLQTAVGIGSQALINGALAIWMLRNRQIWADLRQRIGVAPLLCVTAVGLWAVASALWSQDALLTAHRALPFVLQTLLGIFLACRYSERGMLRLLLIAFAALACWSAVLAVGFPAIGLDASTGHAGDWQGAFTQKNACGRAMVFAIGAALCAPRLGALRMLLLVMFSAELLLSGSRGAWLLGAVAVLSIAILRAASRMERRLRVAFLGGVTISLSLVLVFAVLSFSSLAPMLGRDATLTGRIPIWHQVWLAVLRHPWLGYGFSAFWRGAQPPSWDAVVALRFVLFHAHNGFLEIWLELGAAGLSLFLAGLVRGAWLLWPEIAAGRFREAAWPATMLLLAVLYDIDENTLLAFNGLFWPLYIGALTRTELLAAERSKVRAMLARAPESWSRQRAWLVPKASAFAPEPLWLSAPPLPPAARPRRHAQTGRQQWL